MKNTIPEFDAYIANAAEFARPILEKIRKAAHLACPDIEEAMKWSSPTFLRDGIVVAMSAHKQHVRFGFWKGDLMSGAAGFEPIGQSGMRGLRIEKLSDLPNQKTLVAAIKEAVRLNREGVKAVPSVKKPSVKKPSGKKPVRRPAPKIPADLAVALAKSEKAKATYEGFSPSNKREYVEWITEAKRDATRAKRLAQAIEWMADGKSRNWKYRNC